jgi:hypothetical protein
MKTHAASLAEATGETVDGLLTALLRGEAVSWPDPCAPDQAAFLSSARAHGVLPLIARQLRKRVPGGWPPELIEAIRASAMQQAAAERAALEETRQVLESLAARGVRPLVIKGAALAHTHYPYPCLRPRTDTDILVATGDRARAEAALTCRGYTHANLVSGAVISHQALFVREGSAGVVHAVDLHWKAANPAAFADVLQYEALNARAVAVPALGPAAHALHPVDALLLACVHRVAHHDDGPDLIWLYDVHLLAGSLTDAQWREFAGAAVAKRIAAVCSRGLQLAAQHFGTAMPIEVAKLADVRGEPSSAFLRRDIRRVDRLRSDLAALGGTRLRVRLIRELLFPPPIYMREAYRGRSRGWLPFLYLHRALTGAPSWFRASRTGFSRVGRPSGAPRERKTPGRPHCP